MLYREKEKRGSGNLVRPLTSRQREVLDFIQKYIRRKEFSPSVREIAESLKILSPSSVLGHLAALERKGYIRRQANQSRSIILNTPSKEISKDPKGNTHFKVFTLQDLPRKVGHSRFYLRVDEPIPFCSLVSQGDLLLIHPVHQLDKKNIGVFMDGEECLYVGKRHYDAIQEQFFLKMDNMDRFFPYDHFRLLGVLTAVVQPIGNTIRC